MNEEQIDGVGETPPEEEATIDLTEDKTVRHPERRSSDHMLSRVVESVEKLTATAGSLVGEVRSQNDELRLVREQAARDRKLLRTLRRVAQIGLACLILLIPVLGIVGYSLYRSSETAHDAQVTAKVLQECLTPGYECNARLNELNAIRDQLTVQQISLDRLNTAIQASEAAANAGSAVDAVRLVEYQTERVKVEQTIATLTTRRNELLSKPFPGLPDSAQVTTTTEP